MNYLAHAFLSGKDEGLLVGNFIADHMRGNHLEAYAPAVVEGIRLHRRIDVFTDAHPRFREAKRVFYNGFERYSGVLVDIFFDHLLARNFKTYSVETLPDLAARVYAVYQNYRPLLPGHSSGFLDYVLKNNIYVAYADISGIERVLFHLSHRINQAVQLDDAVQLFNRSESRMEELFREFFEDALDEFVMK